MENPEQYMERLQRLLSRAVEKDQRARIENLSKEFEMELARYQERDVK